MYSGKKNQLPSLDRVQELLSYDPDTGEFRWLKSAGRRVKAGDIAGFISNGYREIQVDSVGYKAHRLAWLMHHGFDPGDNEIDHINLNKCDNRIANLRLVSRWQNCANKNVRRTSSLSVKGVGKLPNGKYRAVIMREGNRTHLGCFSTIEEAASAYREASYSIHGEFGHYGSKNLADQSR